MPDWEKVIKGLKYLHDVRRWSPDESEESITARRNITGDALALLKAQEPITGETSDGYHTFNELYHHRAVLFSVIVANYPDRAWKSKKHHDGTMYDNMFIVGIDTPDGQATYHYDVDPYWDMFKCRVLDNAPEWDGHTPAQAIERIGKLKAQEPRVMTLDEVNRFVFGSPYIVETNIPGDEPRLMYGLYSHHGIAGNYTFDTVDRRRNLYDVDYDRFWRCWTSRPTDEQREAIPWQV